MFSNLFLKSFRVLLLPVSLLYWLVISIRNWLYNKNISRSASFGLPIICIGNLSVGGTGKSPMVEYMIAGLKDKFKIATLSRGYKRRTKGYSLAHDNTTALDIGDEPMQFHTKFPDIPVAVGEERIVAIPLLLHDKPDTQVIILDDAFQHRAITAGLNVLLTDYNNLFTRDFYLPTGDLRDLRSSYKRADIIVVTKCKPDLQRREAHDIQEEIGLLPHQQLFFTNFTYEKPYHIATHAQRELNKDTEILLVAGIANPTPLKKMLEECSKTYYMSHFPDHHIFTIDDLKEIKKRFDRIDAENKIILTTEKDAMRLMKFKDEINTLPLFVIPVKHRFLFDSGSVFDNTIIRFIENFKSQD
jgi:tetraacyldisaccharide 4'-kinase